MKERRQTAIESNGGILQRQPRGSGHPAGASGSVVISAPISRRPVLPLEPLLMPAYPLWKRCIDVAGAIAGIILLAPIMLLITAAIKITSPGPAIFVQARIGFGGRPFRLFKFRSMHDQCSDDLHTTYTLQFIRGIARRNNHGGFKLAGDPRVTPIGALIRKWSLDELPQFFNVLRGDMSLVGPRPDPIYAAAGYAPWYHLRTLYTKPGMTGLWQVEGRSRVDYIEMIRMDIRYSRSISFFSDLVLLLRTFKAVLSHAGAH